jgi:outer membrane receptor protein involved in Fe transport
MEKLQRVSQSIMKKISILILAFSVLSVPAFSQAQSSGSVKQIDIEKMTRQDLARLSGAELLAIPLDDLMKLADRFGVSIDALMNMKTSISSKKALTPRESPGIISVITQEEIHNSGARNLMDVLRLVPGIEFGYDLDGVLGIGIRGIWGHEGKVLLLIDGQEFNELAYSTLQFGNHLGIGNIQRIEILRGPGSSVYGGNAELGVISITTKKSDDINGVYATVQSGFMADAFGRNAVDVGIGKMFSGFDFSITGTAGMGNRTDRSYVDPSGFSYGPESHVAREEFGSLNANVNVKDWSFRFIYDQYQTRTVDYADGENPARSSFESYLAEAKYLIAPNDRFSVISKFNLKYQLPYHNPDGVLQYDRSARRLSGNSTASFDFTEKINLVAGADVYADVATDRASDPDSVFADGSKRVSYHNVSAFAQGLFKLPYTNLILGGRYDDHSASGSAFSPRIGITGPFNRFHYKLIWSRAFRAPGVENLNLPDQDGTPVKPERTTVTEIEFGFKPSDNMLLTLNMFDISIKDPIVYFYDPASDTEWYRNASRTGSAGFELEYRLKYAWGYASASYSYASQGIGSWRHFDKNEVDAWAVPSHDDMVLGFPQQKLALSGSYKFNHISFNPSLTVISSRYGYNSADELERHEPVCLINAFVRYAPPAWREFAIGAGVYNITGKRHDYIQPYTGGLPAHPGPSREFAIRLEYRPAD